MTDAQDLLTNGKIDLDNYETYTLFAGNELGQRFLKEQLLRAVMEPPPVMEAIAFAWQDGRRSVWREIKMKIEEIENQLKEQNHDHGKSRKQRTRNPG